MGDEMERALLLGGPLDFRTVHVQKDQYEILIPLPSERALVAQAMHEVDEMSHIPMTADLRVARYTRQGPLAYRRQVVGAIFEYEETR